MWKKQQSEHMDPWYASNSERARWVHSRTYEICSQVEHQPWHSSSSSQNSFPIKIIKWRPHPRQPFSYITTIYSIVHLLLDMRHSRSIWPMRMGANVWCVCVYTSSLCVIGNKVWTNQIQAKRCWQKARHLPHFVILFFFFEKKTK